MISTGADHRQREGTEAAASWLGVSPAELGLWTFMATVCMLFAAFFSALLVRRSSADWVPIALPGILWWNTAALLASSVTLEGCRAAHRKARSRAALCRLLVTMLLGAVFLLGQLSAWHQLVAHGVYLPTSPHSTFFYLFTGLHGTHLLGGLSFLLYAYAAIRGKGRRDGAGPATVVNACATFWHFLGALWILLFLILSTA